ncbi:hypothetical protein WKI65_43555 [Streptomyces sp. MS1.AVA.3]|uniref:hypothetical protein n=1 Tax=Streptomyces decoyicus TaxID=249567 RepID=UPI0030C051F6
MTDLPAEKIRMRRGTYRRERGAAGPRATRFKVSYNNAELAVLHAAAERDNTALASWVGDAALAVAKETVTPVTSDTLDVLQGLTRSRNQLRRAGNEAIQSARALNTNGIITAEEFRRWLRLLDDAFMGVDMAMVRLRGEVPLKSRGETFRRAW